MTSLRQLLSAFVGGDLDELHGLRYKFPDDSEAVLDYFEV
jgi:hypothetical protein